MEPNGGKHRFLRGENRNKVEEVPRPICYGSGKHRFSRSGNRDEIEEVKQKDVYKRQVCTDTICKKLKMIFSVLFFALLCILGLLVSSTYSILVNCTALLCLLLFLIVGGRLADPIDRLSAKKFNALFVLLLGSAFAVSIYPVSYTHLDVYKRQHKYTPFSDDAARGFADRLLHFKYTRLRAGRCV